MREEVREELAATKRGEAEEKVAMRKVVQRDRTNKDAVLSAIYNSNGIGFDQLAKSLEEKGLSRYDVSNAITRLYDEELIESKWASAKGKYYRQIFITPAAIEIVKAVLEIFDKRS